MASAVELFKLYGLQIRNVVDQSLVFYQQGQTEYDSIIPLVNYPSFLDATAFIKRGLPVMASLVAPEQELPQTRRIEELSIRTVERVKMGRQIIYGARELETMAERQRLDALIPGSNRLLLGFLESATSITESIVLRLTYLTTRALIGQSVTYTDPITGQIWNFSYPDTIPELLPATLTGADRWNQPATATALQMLRAHAEVFYNYPYFQKFPDNMLIRRKNLREVANMISTKRAYLQRQGYPIAGITNADADLLFLEDNQVIEMIKAVTQCKKVVVFDAMAGEPQQDGNVVDTKLLPDDWYCFVEDNNVIRAIVPTIEKFTPNGAPVAGIFVAAKELDDAPRTERLAGVANGFPAIADSRKIAARKIN